MMNPKFYWQTLALPLALSIVSMGAIAAASWANYRPPANLGKPGNREGAATRIARPMLLRESTTGTGSCFTDPNQKLTALVPQDNNGLSSNLTPSLYGFIPANTGATLALKIKNEAGQVLYKQSRTAPTQAGLIAWDIGDPSPLQYGKDYRWEFTLTCLSGTEAMTTESWLRPQALNPQQVTEVKQSQDQAMVFAVAGYWYDALDRLADERQAQPENAEVTQKWQSFLQSPAVQLQGMANQPLNAF